MRPRSLRGRLLLYLLGGAAVISLAAGFVLTTTSASWLRAAFDDALAAKARALAALTEEDAGRVEFDFQARLMPEFGASEGLEFFELWLDGTLLARSPSFDLAPGVPAAPRLREASPAAAPVFRDVLLPDGRRGRQVRIDFVPEADAPDPDEPGEPGVPTTSGATRSDGPRATLLVARERERLERDLGRLRWAVGGATAVLLLALTGLVHLALRVNLRSLDRLTGQVRALDVASLGARLQVPAPPEEIAVVVEQVNALLGRLEAGFRRERQLSSDVAHELKTPIAELRALCEVGGRWPDDREAARQFFDDAGAIARQMERIVVHLVALARCEADREPVWATQVRVADVVEAAWKPLVREAEARWIELRQEIPPDLYLETDPEKLQMVVSNLLANAVTYSPPGTAVECTALQAGERATVTFSNRAEHLEPADLAVMFDRFWRKDPARAGGLHAGLGLALVRALADHLGLEVAARLEADRTFRVTLRPGRRLTA